MEHVNEEPQEAIEQTLLGLNETITPFQGIATLEHPTGRRPYYEAAARIPFRFRIKDKIVEGRMIIAVNERTKNREPEFFPYPIDREYSGYRITAEDFDLDARREKMMAHDIFEDAEQRERGNNVSFSVIMQNKDGGEFPAEEQEKLQSVHCVVSLDDSVRQPTIKEFEGIVYFRNEGLAFGRIDTFFPLDTGPLAHNNPITSLNTDIKGQVFIGPGHGLSLPHTPEIIRPIQVRFIHAAPLAQPQPEVLV